MSAAKVYSVQHLNKKSGSSEIANHESTNLWMNFRKHFSTCKISSLEVDLRWIEPSVFKQGVPVLFKLNC